MEEFMFLIPLVVLIVGSVFIAKHCAKDLDE
jgi:hypothetical protein